MAIWKVIGNQQTDFKIEAAKITYSSGVGGLVAQFTDGGIKDNTVALVALRPGAIIVSEDADKT